MTERIKNNDRHYQWKPQLSGTYIKQQKVKIFETLKNKKIKKSNMRYSAGYIQDQLWTRRFSRVECGRYMDAKSIESGKKIN